MEENLRFAGRFEAETITVRFAFSGRVAAVNKHTGDRVQIGNGLASLDRRVLQMELDRELADYERVRAEFEIFKNTHRDAPGDIEKFELTRKQASLNAAVKQVELSKYRMDQAHLTSPVEGIVLSSGGLRPGLHITPGSYGFEILDMASLHLRLALPREDASHFQEGSKVKVIAKGLDQELEGTVLPLLPPEKKDDFILRIKVGATEGLFPGMEGEVKNP